MTRTLRTLYLKMDSKGKAPVSVPQIDGAGILLHLLFRFRYPIHYFVCREQDAKVFEFLLTHLLQLSEYLLQPVLRDFVSM